MIAPAPLWILPRALRWLVPVGVLAWIGLAWLVGWLLGLAA